MLQTLFGRYFYATMAGAVALVIVVAALIGVFALGGGGDDSPSPTATADVLPTLSGLQGQLAAAVLQQADVPAGLQAAAPVFSTNQDVAGSDPTQLATLNAEGRQLGVDVQFIPGDALDPGSPLKGGIQSSASVYTAAPGASQSFEATAQSARANDWQANYPNLESLKVTEVPTKFGDESVWIRVTGIQECQSSLSPTPGQPTASPTCGEQAMVVLDNVIFRVGRVREFVQVSTLFPPESQGDVYEDQVATLANAAVQHAMATFPSS